MNRRTIDMSEEAINRRRNLFLQAMERSRQLKMEQLEANQSRDDCLLCQNTLRICANCPLKICPKRQCKTDKFKCDICKKKFCTNCQYLRYECIDDDKNDQTSCLNCLFVLDGCYYRNKKINTHDVKKLVDKYDAEKTALANEIIQLKEQIKSLETQVKYQPGGEGFCRS